MKRQLVFDVGFHKGEDTQHYLARGYHVVAVEANPLLAAAGRRRFSREIAEGRLVLLDVGIGAEASEQTFWVNHTHSEWSSFQPLMGQRGEKGSHSVVVRCVTLASLFQAHGIPYYLKIDIEGNDHYCLQGLTGPELPLYVSCEACDLHWLKLLHERGYTRFKLINQFDGFKEYDIARERSRLRAIRNTLRWQVVRALGMAASFPAGSSGPFGQESDGAWHDFAHVAAAYRSFYPERGDPLNGRSWFDFHATRDAV
jgi:FkbM family methyltransferase